MRASEAILAILCSSVAFAGVHLTQAQEATSANLPDQFQTGEMIQIKKSKKTKVESTSQITATAPEQNTAPVPEQMPPTEELPGVTATDEKHVEPSRAVDAGTNITSARITKSAPPPEESAPEVAPVEKKPRPRKRPRPAVQPEPASISAPVPVSLSVAQSMAITAPLPNYTYEMKRRNLSGSGVCVVTVDTATGTVTNATMFQSTGNPLLDRLTMQTFKNWRFKPGTVSRVRVPISYE